MPLEAVIAFFSVNLRMGHEKTNEMLPMHYYDTKLQTNEGPR